MRGYVDGFVLTVPRKNLKQYKKLAQKAGKIWKKYGALEYVETIGSDMSPKYSYVKFPRMAKARKGEAVAFSYIVYKNRKHRDLVNRKVMKDPYMVAEMKKKEPMPFDVKRMAYGGFKVLVDV